jgi:hypothetical protein
MAENAWLEIPHPRYTELWDRFEEAFEFRPSVRPAEWPSFREPSPSITYNITDLLREFCPWRDSRATPYNLGLVRALAVCVSEDEPILALDWQHRAYEFLPHRFLGADDPANWCIPSLPSGECHIFATADYRLGSLGHPWEGSVCVFGAGFVTEYARQSPLGCNRIIRRRGVSSLA